MQPDPTPEPEPAPAPTRAAPWPISAYVGLGDAAVLAVGTFLPWVDVTIGPVNTTGSGLDTSDGKVVLVLAIVAAVLALIGLLQKALLPLYLLVVVGLIAIATCAYDISDVQSTGEDLAGGGDFIQVEAGIGLWICLVGAIGVTTAGVLAFVLDRKRRPA